MVHKQLYGSVFSDLLNIIHLSLLKSDFEKYSLFKIAATGPLLRGHFMEEALMTKHP